MLPLGDEAVCAAFAKGAANVDVVLAVLCSLCSTVARRDLPIWTERARVPSRVSTPQPQCPTEEKLPTFRAVPQTCDVLQWMI